MSMSLTATWSNRIKTCMNSILTVSELIVAQVSLFFTLQSSPQAVTVCRRKWKWNIVTWHASQSGILKMPYWHVFIDIHRLLMKACRSWRKRSDLRTLTNQIHCIMHSYRSRFFRRRTYRGILASDDWHAFLLRSWADVQRFRETSSNNRSK